MATRLKKKDHQQTDLTESELFGRRRCRGSSVEGLMFVGVSTNLERILQCPGVTAARAAETRGTLLTAILTGSLAVRPQTLGALGMETVAPTAVLLVVTTRSQFLHLRNYRDAPRSWSVTRSVSIISCCISAGPILQREAGQEADGSRTPLQSGHAYQPLPTEARSEEYSGADRTSVGADIGAREIRRHSEVEHFVTSGFVRWRAKLRADAAAE